MILRIKTICFFLFLTGSALLFGADSEGTKQSLIDGLAEIASKDPNPVYSVCVIQNGISETRDIHAAARSRNCYSVAKLFTVTAIGILEDRGLLNTDDFVYPIFQDRFPENFDPKWKDVRIRDILTHRIGFDSGFLDIDVEDMRNWESGDFLNLVLSHPLKYAPGEKFAYSDAAFYLASRIVTEKCGERLDDFLIREVANPLGFSEFAFAKCPEGYPMGATGLYISTADMAKLGQLYLQKGEWNGKQILSENFVEKVFREGFELGKFGDTGDAFGKGGMNGQFLYVNRKTGTVFAVHSYGGDLSALLKFLRKNDQ